MDWLDGTAANDLPARRGRAETEYLPLKFAAHTLFVPHTADLTEMLADVLLQHSLEHCTGISPLGNPFQLNPEPFAGNI